MAQATLNGIITDDKGLDCEGRFNYGPTPAMGNYTPWTGGTLRTGDRFWQRVTGLLPNTNYYFQAEARNALGAGVAANMLSFITTAVNPAAVDIMSPTSLTENSAVLRGMVRYDGGRPGKVRFNFGLTVAYGMITGWQESMATGDLFSAELLGLSPGSTYHCRAEFQGSPPAFSMDLAFSTLSAPGGVTLMDDILLLLEAN